MPSGLNDVVARLGHGGAGDRVNNLKPVLVSVELVPREPLREPGGSIPRPDFVTRGRPNDWTPRDIRRGACERAEEERKSSEPG